MTECIYFASVSFRLTSRRNPTGFRLTWEEYGVQVCMVYMYIICNGNSAGQMIWSLLPIPLPGQECLVGLFLRLPLFQQLFSTSFTNFTPLLVFCWKSIIVPSTIQL